MFTLACVYLATRGGGSHVTTDLAALEPRPLPLPTIDICPSLETCSNFRTAPPPLVLTPVGYWNYCKSLNTSKVIIISIISNKMCENNPSRCPFHRLKSNWIFDKMARISWYSKRLVFNVKQTAKRYEKPQNLSKCAEYMFKHKKTGWNLKTLQLCNSIIRHTKKCSLTLEQIFLQ